MRLKLIDHESVTEETQFGTCDFCACTTEATFATLIFKRDDSEVLRAETWYWCWGDMFSIDIDNVFDFAAWIKDKEFPDDLEITDYYTLEGVVEDYEHYKHMKKVGVMHLKLIGHETTDEGTTLVFEKDGNEILRAKTWYWVEAHRLEIHIKNLSDFAAWVARQDFPADLDITDYYELEKIVVDFEDETGRS